MHDHVVALMVAAAFVVACGDGGTAAATPSDHSAVPDDSDVPEENVVPNDADVPNDASAPRDGQAPPGRAPAVGSVGGNCSRLCEHERRFSCELDIPEANCASTCAKEIASARCGAELTSALLCLLDEGVCPEDEEAPSACTSVILRYGRCANESGEAGPDEAFD